MKEENPDRMALNPFSRSERLFGTRAIEQLATCRVAVFGLGGVGSYLAESLARGGVGHLCLVDYDVINITNINRQILALTSTLGQRKTQAMKNRILDIHPEIDVEVFDLFYGADTAQVVGDLRRFDYIADAMDTVSAKLLLIESAQRQNVPIISCMGAGNKVDPTRFEVDDIANTSVCPLARVMRRELRARGIEHLKVVYSREEVRKPLVGCDADESEPGPQNNRRHTPASNSFVPPVAGLIMAGEIIQDLIRTNEPD